MDYLTFFNRILRLDGDVKSTIRMRQILLGDVKETCKEEKKMAFDFMTPAIKEYLDEKEGEKNAQKMEMMLDKDLMSQQIKKNRARRKKNKQRKKIIN